MVRGKKSTFDNFYVTSVTAGFELHWTIQIFTRVRKVICTTKTAINVKSTLGRIPEADLALAATPDALPRARAAQKFAADTPGHAEAHFLLARTELAAGLTGEARRHVQAAHAAGMDQRRLWSLLADIEEAERGDTEAGRAAQRDALKRAAEAGDDPAWHCAACGAAHPAWHPACPACGTTFSLAWRP